MCVQKCWHCYKSFTESVLSIIIWFGNRNLAEGSKLVRLVSVAGKVLGVSQSPLCDIYDRQALRKTLAILESTTTSIKSLCFWSKCYQLFIVSTAINMLNLHKLKNLGGFCTLVFFTITYLSFSM